jgi:transposase
MTAEEELIELRQRNSLLEEQVKQLTEQVKQLQEQLAKNSQNSSLPPSSDRFSRQKKSRSLRTKSGKKPGGQAGHQGHALQMHAEPTEVIPLAPVTSCQHCQADLTGALAQRIERRQVIDVPAPPPVAGHAIRGRMQAMPILEDG